MSQSSQEQRQRLADALAEAAQGNEQAFAEVYSLTSAKLFGICLRILADRGEAEDVLQEVYVSVWRRAASFDSTRGSPIAWLATLARNRAIDRLRSRRAPLAAPIERAAEVIDERPSAFAVIAAGEERGRLMDCIGELEQRQSDAIRSAFLGGSSYPQLAAAAEVPLGTMKSWIRRGLSQLRGCLER